LIDQMNKEKEASEKSSKKSRFSGKS
jgi:hypothetical protein